MSATNISPETAIEVALPASITIDLFDAISTGLWYKYTTTSDQFYLGVQVPTVSAYDPLVQIFQDAGITLTLPGFADHDGPTQNVAEPSHTYYFQFAPNSGSPPPGTNATFTVDAAPNDPAPAGSIFIPDDTPGYRGILLDAVTGRVLRAVPFPAGEAGDVLPDGTMCVEAENDDGDVVSINVYSGQFVLLAELALPGDIAASTISITGDRVDTFFVSGFDNASGVVRSIKNADYLASWTLPGPAGNTAVNEGGHILYWIDLTSTGPTGTFRRISRYDLDGSAPLSDLVGAVAGYHPGEMMVLGDGTILAKYQSDTISTLAFVRHYSAAGATILDYPMADYPEVHFDHLARAFDDPTSFMLWKITDSGIPITSSYITVRVSDGVATRTLTMDNFESGVGPVGTTQKFGPSKSCPFFLLTQPLDSEVCAVIVCPQGYGVFEKTIRRERIAPHLSNDQKNVFYPAIQVEVRPGTGHTIPPGVTPKVMLSVSFDGGYNWTPENWMSAGELGNYRQRVIARQLGYGRDVVFKVVVSDPNAWDLVAAYFDPPPIRGRH